MRVFRTSDLTKECSRGSTSCCQMLSFHPFIGALMSEKHPVDCSSCFCCSGPAPPSGSGNSEEDSHSKRPWVPATTL